MALVVKYKILQGLDESGNEIVLDATIGYSEENLAIAKAEAYNGEVSDPYDDGIPEPESPESRIKDLEEEIDLLLSGVTE